MECILILTQIRLALVFFVIHKDYWKSLWGTRLEIYSFKENIMRNSKLPGSYKK